MVINLEIVKSTAEIRGDEPLDDIYYQQAAQMIESGAVEVERYPMGHPTTKAVYDLAKSLAVSSQN